MRRIHAICRKIFFFFFSKEKLKCNTKGERKKLFFGGEDQSYRVVKQDDQSDESNLPSHIKRRRKKIKIKMKLVIASLSCDLMPLEALGGLQEWTQLGRTKPTDVSACASLASGSPHDPPSPRRTGTKL